jgi:putative heme iron utilization protein
MQPTPDFDPTLSTRKLIRESRSGALATLMTQGGPYCSLVNVATLPDGSPLMLLSQLAIHTRNILADQRVSLMLDERREGDPLEGARVSLIGTIAPTEDAMVRRRYLAYQPEAAMFADFGDFNFYRMTVTTAHLVAGFGRIVDLSARDLLIDTEGAEPLIDAETDVLSLVNANHADAVRLCATRLLGEPDGPWRCVGCDPEGLDLQLGRVARRLTLPERVTTTEKLRESLKSLADQVRTVSRM